MAILRGLLIAPMIALLCHVPLAGAAEPNSQQNKMAVCNQRAANKKGEERKAFIAECLKNKPIQESSQDRMKRCNEEAVGKTGDERKAFLSQCLRRTGPD